MGGDPNCLLNEMILQVGSKLPFFQIIEDGHSSTPISIKAGLPSKILFVSYLGISEFSRP